MKKQRLTISWLRIKGFDKGLLLSLNPTYDKKDYNDYLLIESSAGKGQGYNTEYKIDFKDITDITYRKPLFFGLCTICINTTFKDEKLKDIKVERDSFDSSTMKKIIKIFKKWQQK